MLLYLECSYGYGMSYKRMLLTYKKDMMNFSEPNNEQKWHFLLSQPVVYPGRDFSGMPQIILLLKIHYLRRKSLQYLRYELAN